jgi:hypothetical protein
VLFGGEVTRLLRREPSVFDEEAAQMEALAEQGDKDGLEALRANTSLL